MVVTSYRRILFRRTSPDPNVVLFSADLAIDALCQHPEWASKIMPDGKPLSEDLKAWEQWAYDWLKARATAGLFVVSAPQHSLDSL